MKALKIIGICILGFFALSTLAAIMNQQAQERGAWREQGTEPYPVQACRSTGKLGEAVMFARQQGMDKHEYLDAALEGLDPSLHGIMSGTIEDAWQVPIDRSNPQRHIRGFGQAIYENCLEHRT